MLKKKTTEQVNDTWNQQSFKLSKIFLKWQVSELQNQRCLPINSQCVPFPILAQGIFSIVCFSIFIYSSAPPMVSAINPNVQTILGWPATLSCKYRHVDVSKSIIGWLNQQTNMVVIPSKQLEITTISNNDGTVKYSLVIRNVSRQHLGCYGCYANTSYGRNSSIVCLHLLGSSKGQLTDKYFLYCLVTSIKRLLYEVLPGINSCTQWCSYQGTLQSIV